MRTRHWQYQETKPPLNHGQKWWSKQPKLVQQWSKQPELVQQWSTQAKLLLQRLRRGIRCDEQYVQ